MKRAALLLLAGLWLPGCTQWNYDLGEPLPAAYEAGAEGRSLAQVLGDLGPPLRFLVAEQGMVMAWESWRIQETSVGLSLRAIGIEALEVDWGDARIRGDFLVMTFDRQHRVIGAWRARRDDDIGGGASLQPLGGLVSVVDVDDLLDPLPQHEWGAARLLPLPEALNNAQRPGWGATAIEQRGTPAGAGQRSLAWPD